MSSFMHNCAYLSFDLTVTLNKKNRLGNHFDEEESDLIGRL